MQSVNRHQGDDNQAYKRRSYALALEHPILKEETPTVIPSQNGRFRNDRRGLNILPELRQQPNLPLINEAEHDRTPVRGRRGAPPNRSVNAIARPLEQHEFSGPQTSLASVPTAKFIQSDPIDLPPGSLGNSREIQKLFSNTERYRNQEPKENRTKSPSRIPKLSVGGDSTGNIQENRRKITPPTDSIVTENLKKDKQIKEHEEPKRSKSISRIPSLKRTRPARSNESSFANQNETPYSSLRSMRNESPLSSSDQIQPRPGEQVINRGRQQTSNRTTPSRSHSRGKSPSRIPTAQLRDSSAQSVRATDLNRRSQVSNDFNPSSSRTRRSYRSPSPSRIPVAKNVSSQDNINHEKLYENMKQHYTRSKSMDEVVPKTLSAYKETHFDLDEPQLSGRTSSSREVNKNNWADTLDGREQLHFGGLSSGSESSLGILDIPVQEAVTGLLDLVTSADAMIAKSSKVNHIYYHPSDNPYPNAHTQYGSDKAGATKKSKIEYPSIFGQGKRFNAGDISKSLPQIHKLADSNPNINIKPIQNQNSHRPQNSQQSSRVPDVNSIVPGRIYANYLQKKEELSKSMGELTTSGSKSGGWTSVGSPSSPASLRFPSQYLNHIDPSIEAFNPIINSRFDPPPSNCPSPPPITLPSVSPTSSNTSFSNETPRVGSSPPLHSQENGSLQVLDNSLTNSPLQVPSQSLGNTRAGNDAKKLDSHEPITKRTPDRLVSENKSNSLAPQQHNYPHQSPNQRPITQTAFEQPNNRFSHPNFPQPAHQSFNLTDNQQVGTPQEPPTSQLTLINKSIDPQCSINDGDNRHLRGSPLQYRVPRPSVPAPDPISKGYSVRRGVLVYPLPVDESSGKATSARNSPALKGSFCDNCKSFDCECFGDDANIFLGEYNNSKGIDNEAFDNSESSSIHSKREHLDNPELKSNEALLLEKLKELEYSQCLDLGLVNKGFEADKNLNNIHTPNRFDQSSKTSSRDNVNIDLQEQTENSIEKPEAMDAKRLSRFSNRGSVVIDPVLVKFSPVDKNTKEKQNGALAHTRSGDYDENENKGDLANKDAHLANGSSPPVDLTSLRLSALQNKSNLNQNPPRQMGRRGMSPGRKFQTPTVGKTMEGTRNNRSKSRSAGSESSAATQNYGGFSKSKMSRTQNSSKKISPQDKEVTVHIGSSDVRTKTYKLRFYILGLFSLIAMMQCIIWGTWGPIIDSAKFAFPSWTSGTISLLNSWGPIDCIVFILPVTFLNQKYGLRVGVIFATTLMSVATLLRCIPVDELGFTILANLCGIINGIAGCLTLSLPAMVAATWFPPSERTTATAVAGLFSQLGSAVMYLEPLLVETPEGLTQESCSSVSRNQVSRNRGTRSIDTPLTLGELLNQQIRAKRQTNITDLLMDSANGGGFESPNDTAVIEDSDTRYISPEYPTTEITTSPNDIKHDINILMYIHAGVAVSLLLMTLIYFPAKPRLPPSRSSAVERLDYFASIKSLFKNSQFMLLTITYVFSVGIPVVWVAIMNFNLCCMGIRQDDGMYIAITAVVASCVSAFVAARVTDVIYGHIKVTCIFLLASSSMFFTWFLFNSIGVIPPTLPQVYISIGGAIALQYATVPLLIELAVELSYPCPESVVGAFLTGLFNVISGTFLLLFLIPSACYTWVNYVLVACTSLTIIPLVFVKETHKRRADDEGEVKSIADADVISSPNSDVRMTSGDSDSAFEEAYQPDNRSAASGASIES